jgi:anti-sigma regulatory factor (Ser/Thr protein kinase)
MGKTFSLDLEAARASVPLARHAIRDLCVQAGIGGHRLTDIQIAVTEACTNCVRHAYDATDDSATYTLEARVDAGNLVVVVSDNGKGLRSFTPGLGMKLIHDAAHRVLVTSPKGGGSRIEMHFAPTTSTSRHLPAGSLSPGHLG